MWTPAGRALVGGFGPGQALTDDQFRLLEPLIPPAKPGGRRRSTDMRNLLDGLFHLVRGGCQWRHLPPPPAFPPWPTVYGYMRTFLRDGVWESIRPVAGSACDRGHAARGRRAGSQSHGGDRRHPERENDGERWSTRLGRR